MFHSVATSTHGDLTAPLSFIRDACSPRCTDSLRFQGNKYIYNNFKKELLLPSFYSLNNKKHNHAPLSCFILNREKMNCLVNSCKTQINFFLTQFHDGSVRERRRIIWPHFDPSTCLGVFGLTRLLTFNRGSIKDSPYNTSASDTLSVRSRARLICQNTFIVIL